MRRSYKPISEMHPEDVAGRSRVVTAALDRAEAVALARPAPAPRQLVTDDQVPTDVLATVHAAPLITLDQLSRVTGAVRTPEKFVQFDNATRAAILAAPAPTSGPVVLVIVHTQCGVIGTFDSSDHARAWWGVEWNRLNGSAPYAILPAADVTA
jgi:hypothetical protein